MTGAVLSFPNIGAELICFQLPFCFVAQNEALLTLAAVHFMVHY
jgi:hypothetical protein